MKQFTLSLFFLIGLMPFIQAQTLTDGVIPEAGNQQVFTSADTIGIEPGANGSGNSWNFSSLTPTPLMDPITIYYVSPDQTPFFVDFPTADLASFSVINMTDTAFTYYEKSNDQLTNLGTKSNLTLTDYTIDPEVILKTPLNFGEAFSDDFEGTTNAAGNTIYHSGSKVVTYDANGSIQIADEMYSNSIRLKTMGTRTDSTAFGSTVSITTTSTEQYSWFVNGIKGSVMDIFYTSGESRISINGGPPIITPIPRTKSVSYNPEVSVVTSTYHRPKEVEVSKIYPNPAHDHINIKLSRDKKVNLLVSLTDLVGREVQGKRYELTSGEQLLHLDISELPQGMYILTVYEGTVQKSFRVFKS